MIIKNYFEKGASVDVVFFLHGISFEADEYEKAESPFSTDSKIIDFDPSKN